jgi:hypothetical protein
MPTALADKTAAQTAGYSFTTVDRGSSHPAAVRFFCTAEKRIMGGSGQSGSMLRAYGEASSQAAAEAQAVAALNAQRDFRYGKAAASPAFTINHSSDTCRS